MIIADESNKFKSTKLPGESWLIFFSSTFILVFFINFFGFYDFESIRFASPKLFYALLANFLFFNTLHVPITFVNLLVLPEFKMWVQKKKSVLGSFKYEIFAVFFLFCIISYYGFKLGGYVMTISSIPFPDVYFFSIILFFTLTAFHGLGQTYGLSNALHTGEIKDKSHLAAQKTEKILFYFMIASHGVNIFYLFERNVIKSESQNLAAFFTGSVYVVAFATVAILINCFRYPAYLRKRKFLFLSRLLVYPFFPYSWLLASFVMQSNHGLEYVFINSKIAKNSKYKSLPIYILFIFIALLIWTVLTLPRYINLSGALNINVLLIGLSVFTAIDLSHYWLDRLIYRFSNPESRQYILPLIMHSPEKRGD